MKRTLVVLCTGFVMFLVSFVWAADSALVEASKKEKERRAKIKTSAPVVDNKTIEEFKKKQQKDAGGADTTTDQDADVSNNSGADSNSAQSVTPNQDEEQVWRQRYDEAAGRVEKAQKQLDQLQTNLRAADDAYLFGSEPDTLGLQQHRMELIDQIQAAQNELNSAQQGVEQLQQSAKEQGIPPGYVESRQ